jgi:hypothetical protein
LGDEDITVIADGEFAPYVIQKARLYSFRDPGSLLKGIWHTRDMWEADDIIILLGDVVFSNAAIDYILNVYSIVSCVLFWREALNPITGKTASERFGVSIPKGAKEEFIGDIFHLWKFIEAQGRDTKLWDYQKYRALSGWTFDDYTDDIDSPEEYDQFWGLLSGAALEDDEKL